MTEMLKYILMVGFLGAALALAGVGVAQAGFQEASKNEAFLAAFPITERVVTAINYMESQNENGFVEILLPRLTCTVDFSDRYVETTVVSGGVQNGFGLFIFRQVEVTSPVTNRIQCDPNADVTVRVENINGQVRVKQV